MQQIINTSKNIDNKSIVSLQNPSTISHVPKVKLTDGTTIVVHK